MLGGTWSLEFGNPKNQPKMGLAAFNQNQTHLKTHNDADHRLLSKCPLQNDLSSVFNPPVFTLDDKKFVPSAWFFAAIKAITRTPTPTPKPAPFKFSIDTTSVAHNTQILQETGNNFATIINDNQDTLLSYSSEFRSLDDLSSIYRYHDTSPFFASVHQQGKYYAFAKMLSNNERMAELAANIARRNHRLATERPEILEEKLERYVKFVFSVPVCASSLLDMPGTMVQACGLAVQHVLKGIKYRLAHNLSFSITGEDVSVNSRCDVEAYPEMVYGFCLSRTIHFIVALRGKYPEERILISKYGFSDAYRRMAHGASLAIQTILVHGVRAYIYLRLTFGASANLAVWYGFSEMVCDLSDKITLIGNWDPDILFSPIQPTVPDPIYIDPLVPLAPAKAMAVKVPTVSLGRGGYFLDNIIKVFLARWDIIKRNATSVPLTMHVSMRPLAKEEPVPRKETFSLTKLLLKETPSDLMIVLGWLIDTRRLLLRLPKDKHERWKKEIRDLLTDPKMSKEDLESLIGKLVHAVYVIPLSHHFLLQLRDRLALMKAKKIEHLTRIYKEEIEDVKL